MAVEPKRLTLEEFLQLPEGEPALEYVDGGVKQKVSPKGAHGVLQATLAQMINEMARPRKIALAVTEVRTTFGGQSRVPDISVYRWDRIPRLESGEVADDFLTPPDIAVKIVSPGQSFNSLVRRCRWYVINGVGIALVVDPADRSILAFLPDGSIRESYGTTRIDLSPILPDFELTADDLFQSLKV